MRSSQVITLLLLGTIFTVAVVLTLISFGILSGPNVAKVPEVPPGSQEIAVLAPATSVDVWERLVGALKRVHKQLPTHHKDMAPLEVDLTGAFPGQSAAVPQLAVWSGDGAKGKLLIRWYKISGGKGAEDWIADLAARPTPPLAIIGGETTRRAQDISRELESKRAKWQGPAPLFLITTATADNLISLYPGRNYRFSFTNSTMTRAVLDFIHEQPELLWPRQAFDLRVAAAMFGTGNGLTNAMLLQLEQKALNYAMFGLSWDDDPYSQDLSKRFLLEFQKRYYPSTLPVNSLDSSGTAVAKGNGKLSVAEFEANLNKDQQWRDYDSIKYSTGDLFNPNYFEAAVALRFSDGREKSKSVRQLIALPTSTERARRFLKAVINCDPKVVRNLAVVCGDSITFNQIYRDRKVAWNILDLPVPLVIFSHRNPVYSDPEKDENGNTKIGGFLPEGTEERPWAASGTQDLLLHRDILEAVIVAAYRGGSLVANADELDYRLSLLHWAIDQDQEGKTVDGHITFAEVGNKLFDLERNRCEGTGEYVILLEPQRQASGVLLPQSTISVWARKTVAGEHQSWEAARVLENVFYTDAPTQFEVTKKQPK